LTGNSQSKRLESQEKGIKRKRRGKEGRAEETKKKKKKGGAKYGKGNT